METIRVDSVSKSYGKIQALAQVSFSVSMGDIVGYIGPNGSGKTTTIKIITGLCKADAGSVSMLSKNVRTEYPRIGNRIAVIFEEPSDYDYLTAWENLEFYARLINMPGSKRKAMIRQSLENMDLAARKDTLVKTFSKGMKRKLSVARALLAEPQILVLDEPFDGIDVSSRVRILDYLKRWVQQDAHSILLTSHNMYEVEHACNKIVMLKEGRILASGALEELRSDRLQYNVEVALGDHSDRSAVEEALSRYGKDLVYKFEGRRLLLAMDNHAQIAGLASHLFACNIDCDGISKRHETLNDVYLRVIGHHE